MPNKSPSKGKKAAPRESAKKPGRPPKIAKAAAPRVSDEEVVDDPLDDGDDEPEIVPAKAAAAPAKKPQAQARPGGKLPGEVEAPPLVPARRLTPEAKAKVNEMVAKGMPLGDALKVAASWETFVAPVKDEPAKLVQGKSFEGGRGGGFNRRRGGDEEGGGRSSGGGETESDDEEPVVTEAEE